MCKDTRFYEIINLGDQALTGYFPKKEETISKSPLVLVSCSGCHLSQLLKSEDIKNLYTEGYGYESHLNSTMRNHLGQVVSDCSNLLKFEKDDVVLDIASNDGTLLSSYEQKSLTKVGIDPLIDSFSDFYPNQAIKIRKFFSANAYLDHIKKPAKLITACSVFYDLENPEEFMQDIDQILDVNGICLFEQSYFYSMIETLSYDTICHEHLLYLRLLDFQKLLIKTNLEIFDVKFNDVNGGSFQVFIKKRQNLNLEIRESVVDVLKFESNLNISENHLAKIKDFRKKVTAYPSELLKIINNAKYERGRRIFGLGASTKGNVLLQYCSLGPSQIEAIGEINPKKFGRFTPGSDIPIISESEILSLSTPITLFILPWHFSTGIMKSIQALNKSNFDFLIPLPNTPTHKQ